ncbi:MAG TPA: BTAD domain-containing putative transcriptional regulator [Gaiellaceae bacterium]|nr:BTAD domain-containing putative transcriptional regulator [Gaiellaceae bacterium]
MSVRLNLLRGFELLCDDVRVSLPLASQRLLAFLALQQRPMLRIYVAGALWLDASESRSYANLRSALWRLRQPGHPVVVATPTHLALHDDVEVDVHLAIESSRRALAPAGTGVLVDGDDLAGELLPDWYDDWVEDDRRRLRQLRLHALEAIAEQLLEQGRFGQAVDASLLAIRIDPLRESAQRLLIRTYAAEGNWNEALDQYRSWSRRLRAETGLEPSDRMHALLDDLLGRVRRAG